MHTPNDDTPSHQHQLTPKHRVKKGGTDPKFRRMLRNVFFWNYYWRREVYGKGHLHITNLIDFSYHTYINKEFEFEFTPGRKNYEAQAKEKVSKVLGDMYKSVDKTWKKVNGKEGALYKPTKQEQDDMDCANYVRSLQLPPWRPPCPNKYRFPPPLPWSPPHAESPMRAIIDVDLLVAAQTVALDGHALGTNENHDASVNDDIDVLCPKETTPGEADDLDPVGRLEILCEPTVTSAFDEDDSKMKTATIHTYRPNEEADAAAKATAPKSCVALPVQHGQDRKSPPRSLGDDEKPPARKRAKCCVPAAAQGGLTIFSMPDAADK